MTNQILNLFVGFDFGILIVLGLEDQIRHVKVDH